MITEQEKEEIIDTDQDEPADELTGFYPPSLCLAYPLIMIILALALFGAYR